MPDFRHEVGTRERSNGRDTRGEIPDAAPRIDPRLLAAIGRLDDRQHPLAETNRRVGRLAAELGLPRPSYEQVRTLVHAARNGRRRYDWSDAAFDLSFRARAPESVARLLIEGAEVPESK